MEALEGKEMLVVDCIVERKCECDIIGSIEVSPGTEEEISTKRCDGLQGFVLDGV